MPDDTLAEDTLDDDADVPSDPDAGDPGPECMDPVGPASHFLLRMDGDGQQGVSDVVVTPGGDILVAGATGPYGEVSQAWLVRIDGTGNVLEQHVIEGVTRQSGPSLAPTRDCGLVVAGATRESGEGELDLWLARLDADGSLLWQETIGTPGNDHKPNVLELSSGGFVVSAQTRVEGSGDDLWLLGLADDGSIDWQYRVGGERNEVIIGRNSMVEGPDGTLYVLCQSHSTTDSMSDAWLLALEPDGSILWQKAIGGVPGLYINTAVELILAGGDLVFVGQTQLSSFPGHAAWLVRMTTSGDLVWQKACGNFGNDSALRIARRGDGGFLVQGQVHLSGSIDTHYDLWLASFDPDGAISWQTYLGGEEASEEAAGLVRHGDGIVLLGQHEELDEEHPDPSDAVIARLGSDGSFEGPCPMVREGTSFCGESVAEVVETDFLPQDTSGVAADAALVFSLVDVAVLPVCPE